VGFLQRWFTTTFQALSNPQFRLLWIGSLFSMLAFMMQWTVQSVVAFELGGTNSAVGLVQLGVGLCMLILGPFGGVIADRVSKKPLLFWGQLIVAGSFFVTGAMILMDVLTLTGLVLLTAVMGLVFAFLSPAQQAWVGEMVPQRTLPNAVALSQLAANGSRVAGPFVAGLLLGSSFGAGGAYIMMGTLFIGVIVTVWMLPQTHAKPASERRSVGSELMEGLRYVAASPPIRTLMLLLFATVVVGFMWQIVLPAFLERHLDRPTTDVGMVLTVNAVAALAVALPLTSIVGTRWAWPAMLGCAVLLGIGFLLLANARTFEAALIATVFMGPGLSGFMLVNNALIMSNIEPGYFGRVMSLTMLAWGLQGAMSLPFGYLADVVGERQMLAILGGTVLLVAVVGSGFAYRLARSGQLARPPEQAVS
tara:strand:+ start:726 stop:1988 length:1263 start_codon:yes stop_codon:yes gene_type:complete